MIILKLSSVDAADVLADMEKIIPEWTPARLSPFRGIAFIKLPDVVLKEAVFDEDDNLVTPEVLAGETRIDVIVPDNYNAPDLVTRVYPISSDHQLY